MNKKIKRLSLVLAVLITLGLFTALSAITISAEEPNTVSQTIQSGGIYTTAGVVGSWTAKGPAKVNVGETFTIDFTYTYNFYELDRQYPGSYAFAFNLDTRYVTIQRGTIPAIGGDPSWEEVSAYGEGTVEATDKSAPSMKEVTLGAAVFIDDLPLQNSLTVRATFRAVSAGTAKFEWGYAGIADQSYAYEMYAPCPETPVTSTFAIEVVDPNASSEGPSEPPYIPLGDVNGDGKVDNLDAAFILKYDAAAIDLTDDQLVTGDVNGDGEVDNLDAAFILKYDAGVIENL